MTNRTRVLGLALLLTGCTGDDAGVDACTSLTDGAWTADGTALGMPMEMVVTMDVEGCSFTITDWGMSMASLPDGGTIEGDQVTLTGDDSKWATCTGTVTADGTSVDGACSEDGTAFTLTEGATGTMTM